MSLPTDYGDDWWLIKNDPKDIVEELKDENGNTTGFQKRKLHTIVMARSVFRYTTLKDEMGKTRASFDLRTGPDSKVALAWTGRKFLCVAHPQTLSDPTTGKYDEEQTWIYKSEPEAVPAGTFG